MAQVVTTTRKPSTAANVIYVLFGILEALLAFRFIFQLLGANPAAGFVRLVYSLTGIFMAPFYGIFGQPITTRGTVTVGYFDLSILVAMLVYALIGWAIIRLVIASENRPVDPAA